MELHRRLKSEESGSFEEINGDANVLAGAAKDAITTVSEMKASSNSLSFIYPGGNNDERKTEPSCQNMKGKTKSISEQFAVNIDELVNNDARSFDEKGCILSRASSNGLGSSFPCAREKFSSENISDVVKLQTSNFRESATSISRSGGKEDSHSLSLKKLQIELTVPIYLKFEDVKYKVAVMGVKRSEVEKNILHGITGSVHPGEVLALMGPSGGGKTTLLNLLSGRIKLKSGTITYNDQPYAKSLNKRIGFVTQDDVLFPHLTVKETLTYAALLRLPNTLTRQQKKDRAAEVISELGLERCQNTIIGGISGGERKRLCIGNEILLNPSLLFLDEPTSGLDSTTALRIIQMLQNFSEAGRTVVTTIHQPSSRLFCKFDKLILLGKGTSLYSGRASEAMGYFSSIGCSPLISMNPAEFLIDLANGNVNDKSFPSELGVKFLSGSQKLENGELSPVDVHEYLVEAYGARMAKLKRRKLLKPVVIEGEIEMQTGLNSRENQTTWWEQFSILFRRGLKERRQEYLSCLRLTQVISTAIIIGLLWFHSDSSLPNRIQDQAGLLFFISVFWGFYPMFTAIFTFPQERAMLAKERSVNMYKLSAYFLARNVTDLPLDLILPIVFLVIVYLMAGLKPSFIAFSLTTLTVFLSIVAAQGLGLVIGAAFMDVKKATALASVIVMTFMLPGGFFIQKVPFFMSWVRYISFNYHSYRLLLKIQYSCSGSYSCESPFIRELRLDRGGPEVGAIVAMIIGYRLLAYVFLRRIKLKTMA